ncbi:unnamed protein product [Lathyrus oleraceus]
MGNTKISALTMLFLLAFFTFASDMCMKSEGKGFGEMKTCKIDKECESYCVTGNGVCDLGWCWCFRPPSSVNSIPIRIVPN